MMMTVRHQICLWWCLSVYFSINISRPHFHNDPPSVNHLCTKVQRKTHQAKTSFVLNHHYHYYVLKRMNRKISDKESDRSNFPFSDVKFCIYSRRDAEIELAFYQVHQVSKYQVLIFIEFKIFYSFESKLEFFLAFSVLAQMIIEFLVFWVWVLLKIKTSSSSLVKLTLLLFKFQVARSGLE